MSLKIRLILSALALLLPTLLLSLVAPSPVSADSSAGVPGASGPPPVPGQVVVEFLDDHLEGATDHADDRRRDDPDLARWRREALARANELAKEIWRNHGGQGAQNRLGPMSVPAATGSLIVGGIAISYDAATPSHAKPAIEAGVSAWADKLSTNGAPVVIDVVWQSFGDPGVIGFAGPTGFYPSAALPTGYLYPVALANVLTGSDVNGSNPEITVFLNSDLDANGSWYYGSSTPGSNQIDLTTAVTHELGHGFGFVSSASDSNGPIQLTTPPFVYDSLVRYHGTPLENVPNVGAVLTSGNADIKVSSTELAPLFVPSTWYQGTSASHFRGSGATSSSLMSPTLAQGLTNRTIDDYTMGVIELMGWPTKASDPGAGGGPANVRQRWLDHQVFRVYQAHFLRAPDQAGFNFWFDQRARGTSLIDIIVAFQGGTEFINRYGALADRDFVQLVYQNVLGRAADDAGANHWTSQLAAGMTRAEMMRNFAESPEYVRRTSTLAAHSTTEGSIRRLYQAYFLRAPATANISYWVGVAESGTSLIGISDFFAGSAEFNNTYGNVSDGTFVNLVYRNVLGRTADSGGYAHWTGQLAAGMSRGEVMVGFSESVEFIKSTGTIPQTP